MTATVTRTGLIDETVALDLLDKAVARYGPDHVDEDEHWACRYFVNGQPSCIVAVCFVDFGVPLDAFDDDMVNTGGVRGLPPRLASLTDRGALVLEQAQIVQDGGGTWGEAAAAAHRYVTTRTGGSL